MWSVECLSVDSRLFGWFVGVHGLSAQWALRRVMDCAGKYHGRACFTEVTVVARVEPCCYGVVKAYDTEVSI